MGQNKEALRAPTLAGPRAALTRWGVAEVPEPGKNTDKVWLRWLSLLRNHKRSGAMRRCKQVARHRQPNWQKTRPKMPPIPS